MPKIGRKCTYGVRYGASQVAYYNDCSNLPATARSEGRRLQKKAPSLKARTEFLPRNLGKNATIDVPTCSERRDHSLLQRDVDWQLPQLAHLRVRVLRVAEPIFGLQMQA